MIKIEVNSKVIEAYEGETILTALKREGIEVPTLCHMKDLTPTGACRICVVEVEGMNGLIPSCSYPVADGMKIYTHSPKAVTARKTIIELLLADHPDDCLYCVRNGNCDLSDLAQQYGVRRRNLYRTKKPEYMDLSSPSLIREPEKCILCGKCVRVCEEIQAVAAIDFTGRGSGAAVECAFNSGLNVSSCINCGQCINVCPTGALAEHSSINEVVEVLNDPNLHVVVQHAPSISVTLAEEFGMKPGEDVAGKMNAAFRKLGFNKVFDTSFSADLTIMEEASEFVQRVLNKGTLPMMTSCSPGWVKFVEQFYPDMIPNLSSCKSPQQMLGAVVKSYYADKQNIDVKKIVNVSIMPCTAKKFEAKRPELGANGISDIDIVLTTREFAELVKMFGLDIKNMTAEQPDLPFGERSSAGKLFGATGGVMEAAIRTAYFLITGEELTDLIVSDVRGDEGRKESKLKINDLNIGVAVVSGLKNARELLEEIKNGRDDIHFIEVMTCPGGCINGGGQPINKYEEAPFIRMNTLYNIDKNSEIRVSHKNKAIKELYKEFLGEPLSEKSHHILHTTYEKRDVMK